MHTKVKFECPIINEKDTSRASAEPRERSGAVAYQSVFLSIVYSDHKISGIGGKDPIVLHTLFL